jgi:hypothetical protein
VSNFALSDGDTSHAYPTDEEHVQPHIEYEPEISPIILGSDAGVEPGAMSFVVRDTFLTDITVLGALSFNNFALGTDVFGGD